MFLQLLYWAVLVVSALSFLMAVGLMGEFLMFRKERTAGCALSALLIMSIVLSIFGLLTLIVGLKGLGFWA